MITIILFGALSGAFSMWLGGIYYEKRFEKKFEKMALYCLISALLTAFAGSAFVSFGYMITDTIALMGFVSCMLVISRIDRLEMIIPNCILMILIALRTVLHIVSIFIDSGYALKCIKSSVLGMVFWMVIFGLVRLLYKDKIGMGDIKSLIVFGYYFGLLRCSLMLMVVLIIAFFSIVARIVFKKMKSKEYVSFGPFLAAGSYIALVLGL